MTFPVTDEPILDLWYPEEQNFKTLWPWHILYFLLANYSKHAVHKNTVS